MTQTIIPEIQARIKTKKIIAVETCTNICSVAVWNGTAMYEKIIETERSHSKQILPMCQQVLDDAGITMQDIDAVACTRGPGAFTGLRIGVGVAKGLAFGQDVAIYGLSSLLVLAYRTIQEHSEQKISTVTALLDARMGELYCGRYKNNNGVPELIGDECLTDIESICTKFDVLDSKTCIFAGTGAKEYQQQLITTGVKISHILYPTAQDIIAVIHNGGIQPVSATELEPIYLRDKVTY